VLDKPTCLILNHDHVSEGNNNLIGVAKVDCLMIEKQSHRSIQHQVKYIRRMLPIVLT